MAGSSAAVATALKKKFEAEHQGREEGSDSRDGVSSGGGPPTASPEASRGDPHYGHASGPLPPPPAGGHHAVVSPSMYLSAPVTPASERLELALEHFQMAVDKAQLYQQQLQQQHPPQLQGHAPPPLPPQLPPALGAPPPQQLYAPPLHQSPPPANLPHFQPPQQPPSLPPLQLRPEHPEELANLAGGGTSAQAPNHERGGGGQGPGGRPSTLPFWAIQHQRRSGPGNSGAAVPAHAASGPAALFPVLEEEGAKAQRRRPGGGLRSGEGRAGSLDVAGGGPVASGGPGGERQPPSAPHLAAAGGYGSGRLEGDRFWHLKTPKAYTTTSEGSKSRSGGAAAAAEEEEEEEDDGSSGSTDGEGDEEDEEDQGTGRRRRKLAAHAHMLKLKHDSIVRGGDPNHRSSARHKPAAPSEGTPSVSGQLSQQAAGPGSGSEGPEALGGPPADLDAMPSGRKEPPARKATRRVAWGGLPPEEEEEEAPRPKGPSRATTRPPSRVSRYNSFYGPSRQHSLYEEDGGGVEEGSQVYDEEILTAIYEKVRHKKKQLGAYRNLLSFTLFTTLYCTVLYLQASSFRTYEVSTAHASLLPPGIVGNPAPFDFLSASDIYSWINSSIIQVVWQDPLCGNGICEGPIEYQAWGPFGCQTDCGTFQQVTNINVKIQTNFDSIAHMAASDWNLCLVNPVQQCWYPSPQTFTDLATTLEVQLAIPDGDWAITLDAPYGGIEGSLERVDADGETTTLARWGVCITAAADSQLLQCRDACSRLAQCAEEVCEGYSPTSRAGLFIDCAGACNANAGDTSPSNTTVCSTIVGAALSSNSSFPLRNLQCSRKVAATGNSPPAGPVKHVERRLTEPISSQLQSLQASQALASAANTTFLWGLLGPSDALRLRNLQLAVSRALFTITSSACLAGAGLDPRHVEPMAAFLCTWLGGPPDLLGCTYRSAVTNTVLTTDPELMTEMRRIHARMGIGLDQQGAFVTYIVASMNTVAVIIPQQLQQLDARLHELDAATVETDSVTSCNTVDVILPWMVGVHHNTTITQGQSVQWLWEDDEPHSIRAVGLGDVLNDTFTGLGSGRLVLSRNTLCSPYDIGAFNVSNEPIPCVIPLPFVNGNVFSYTKVFKQIGTFEYECARFGAQMTGRVTVVPSAAVSAAAQQTASAESCAPGCTMGLLFNGVCNVECNNAACVFDGGDCSCSPNTYGQSVCSCPFGQTHGVDGSCCQSNTIGTGLSFPFSMRVYGPDPAVTDANFVQNEEGLALTRFVVERNRVLIGLLMTQKRRKAASCNEHRFRQLSPSCGGGRSTAPFGVNPVFLQTSSLYNAAVAANPLLYYNNTPDNFNADGLPFGFRYIPTKGFEGQFSYIFDINLNNEGATVALQYAVDGLFFDNATEEAGFKLITYNGDSHVFTSTFLSVTTEVGGKMAAYYNIESISVELYRTVDDWLRMCLELLFAVGVLYNLVSELKELYKICLATGSVLPYFSSPWNWIDGLSISIMVSGICLWLSFIISQAQPFEIEPRYSIYKDLHARSPYWELDNLDVGYKQAMSKFAAVDAMITFRSLYFAIQGINIFFMVLRMLKLMDFQPRMGVITRTLSSASSDLLHFFILWLIVFIGYALFGHIVFGRTIDQFRSLPASMVTCFVMMIQDDSVNYFLVHLKGWELVAGEVFFWSYIIFVDFILFNLIIAIVIDAFMDVKAHAESAPMLPAELLLTFRDWYRQFLGPFRNDRSLLRQLRRLGASGGQPFGKVSPLYEVDEEDEDGAPTEAMSMSSSARRALQVIKLDDEKELDTDALQAVLDRAIERQKCPKNGIRGKMVPAPETADFLIRQYGQLANQQRPRRRRNSKRKDVEYIKEMLAVMVETIDESKEQLHFELEKLREQVGFELASIREQITYLPAQGGNVGTTGGGGGGGGSDGDGDSRSGTPYGSFTSPPPQPGNALAANAGDGSPSTEARANRGGQVPSPRASTDDAPVPSSSNVDGPGGKPGVSQLPTPFAADPLGDGLGQGAGSGEESSQGSEGTKPARLRKGTTSFPGDLGPVSLPAVMPAPGGSGNQSGAPSRGAKALRGQGSQSVGTFAGRRRGVDFRKARSQSIPEGGAGWAKVGALTRISRQMQEQLGVSPPSSPPPLRGGGGGGALSPPQQRSAPLSLSEVARSKGGVAADGEEQSSWLGGGWQRAVENGRRLFGGGGREDDEKQAGGAPPAGPSSLASVPNGSAADAAGAEVPGGMLQKQDEPGV